MDDPTRTRRGYRREDANFKAQKNSVSPRKTPMESLNSLKRLNSGGMTPGYFQNHAKKLKPLPAANLHLPAFDKSLFETKFE